MSIPLLVLMLIAGTAFGSSAPPPLHSDCPPWLVDYVSWHRANKFAPDSKYLLYDCRDASCAGLGDRLRGISWLLRMAVSSKRVLVIRMDIPVSFQLFFSPTHIDWTVPATTTVNGQAQTLQPPDAELSSIGDYYSEALMREFSNRTEKWIFGKPNQMEDYLQPEQPKVELYSRATSCMLQSLFQPTAAVEQVVSQHLSEMQVNPSQPYVAVHLRIWNMKGEGESTAHTLQSEERILTSIMCARQMAAQCGVDLSVNPIVLITDGVHIRRRVALRLYHQLTTSAITPHHFDAQENHGLIDRHMETIADFVIMSRATGLFTDAMSGFSRLASYLGGMISLGSNPCLQQNQICVKYLENLDYRVPLSR